LLFQIDLTTFFFWPVLYSSASSVTYASRLFLNPAALLLLDPTISIHSSFANTLNCSTARLKIDDWRRKERWGKDWQNSNHSCICAQLYLRTILVNLIEFPHASFDVVCLADLQLVTTCWWKALNFWPAVGNAIYSILCLSRLYFYPSSLWIFPMYLATFWFLFVFFIVPWLYSFNSFFIIFFSLLRI